MCDYIYDNYVQFSRLRHDVISNKVQIAVMGEGLRVTGWRDITTSDINDIVCDCSSESGLQITAREVLAVLQSHRIPDVHPLREYVLGCKPYTEDQPDWIGWLSEQVKVEGDEEALADVFGADSLAPNGLYEVTKDGVTWYYQPYDIAPYYLGVISITIPWSELKPYLR